MNMKRPIFFYEQLKYFDYISRPLLLEKHLFCKIFDLLVAVDVGTGFVLGFVLTLREAGMADCDITAFCDELIRRGGRLTRFYSNDSDLLGLCVENGLYFEGRPPKAAAGVAGGAAVEALEISVICRILNLTKNRYKVWRKTWPDAFKRLRKKEKVRDAGFQSFLFESSFFSKEAKVGDLLAKGVVSLNSEFREASAIIPSSSVKMPINKDFQGLFGALPTALKPASFEEVKKEVRASFYGLAFLQFLLLEGIGRLEAEVKALTAYKERAEAEKKAKEERRQKRLRRKRRAQSQPFLKEYLPFIMAFVDKSHCSHLTKTRLKLAVVLLVVTGVRVSEIRFTKVSQIVTLFVEHYLEVDLLKSGSKRHKIFLDKEGDVLLGAYWGDLVNLLYMQGFIKKLPIRKNRKTLSSIEPTVLDSFLFCHSSSNGQKPLSRSFFTRQLNDALHQTPELRHIQLSSHSFRRGYITDLWKKTGDLEFVAQVVGHLSLDVTRGYVAKLSDDEKRDRLTKI